MQIFLEFIKQMLLLPKCKVEKIYEGYITIVRTDVSILDLKLKKLAQIDPQSCPHMPGYSSRCHVFLWPGNNDNIEGLVMT